MLSAKMFHNECLEQKVRFCMCLSRKGKHKLKKRLCVRMCLSSNKNLRGTCHIQGMRKQSETSDLEKLKIVAKCVVCANYITPLLCLLVSRLSPPASLLLYHKNKLFVLSL